MDLKQLSKIIGVKNKINDNIKFNNIITNSKEIQPGDIFLTINTGYLYIKEAIEKGAVAIITSVSASSDIVPIMKVKDTKRTLKTLASYYRTQYNGKVIAITGSTGKTTTKELLNHILGSKSRVLCNLNSENNLLGVSQTLLKLNNNYEYLILELGMNHKGEISELSYLAKPDIGIITNIGTSHIGNLGSQENIFKAKLEILDGNPNMNLLVNGKDKYLSQINAQRVIPIDKYENIHPVSSALVIEIGLLLGYSKKYIEKKFKSFNGISSRMEKLIIKKHLVIDDAYNASYESFLHGLETIKQYNERKIIIFGDILELGSYSDYYHQKVFDNIKLLSNVNIITFGQETARLNNMNHFYELENLKQFLKSIEWYDDDIIYLKASHKLNLSSLIPFFKELW